MSIPMPRKQGKGKWGSGDGHSLYTGPDRGHGDGLF